MTINDDWDAASLAFNLTRRDSGSPENPLPIAGTTPAPVNSTYLVGATVCGTGGPALVLTHGILESKLYVAVPTPALGSNPCVPLVG